MTENYNDSLPECLRDVAYGTYGNRHSALLHDAADEIDRLRTAIKAISDGKQSTFRHRVKDVGIESDGGEKCWIVHSDLIHAAEVAANLA